MLRSTVSRAMAVGRFASAVFGLALVVALVVGLTVGAASVAFGANGKPFLLGRSNVASALTKLTANKDGVAMEVLNTNNPGNDDSALSLKVQPGEVPMRVNSGARVPNLNADKLDGFEPSQIKGAKAYAIVDPNPGGTLAFVSGRTSGFTSVERTPVGQYCLTAPGLSSANRPALTSVEDNVTGPPRTTAAAIYEFDGCGDGFRVETSRTDIGSGGDLVDNRADDVGFVIVVP